MKKLLLSIFILLCFNPSAYSNDFATHLLNKTKALKNIAYGSHPQQVMDVYFPTQPLTDKTPAPLIVMVHGGAWIIGDKNKAAVVKNKMDYWNKQGWVFISINYS